MTGRYAVDARYPNVVARVGGGRSSVVAVALTSAPSAGAIAEALNGDAGQARTAAADAARVIERLGGLLAAERRRCGLSYQEVGEATGLAGSTVLRIERGEGCSSVSAAALLRWLSDDDHR